MGFETFIDEITTTANRGLASGGLIAKFNGISSIELCTKLNICASIAPPTQSPETLAEIQKTMKRQLLIAFFSIFLICCESKKNKNSEFIGTYKIEHSSDSILLSFAILKITSGNKYEYSGKDLEMNKAHFSDGTWKIKNDTLILSTTENQNCYFVKETISFQCENFANDDYSSIVAKPYFESNLTIKNCTPKDSNTFYTNLNNEKFFLSNKKLTYKQRKNDCSKYFPEIKLEIKKQN